MNDLGWYIYITFSFSFNVVEIKEKEALNMRGYFTAGGFFGLVDGEYRLFASEADYYEAVEQDDEAA